MFLKIIGRTVAGFRSHAGIDQEELAGRVGKDWQAIDRLEKGDRKTHLKDELVAAIIRATGVTHPVIAQCLAEAATECVGVRLVVLPPDVLVPSIDVLKAVRMFSSHGHKLDKKERESIDTVLDELRDHSAASERLDKRVAKDIIRRIENARIKLGEKPSDDSEY